MQRFYFDAIRDDHREEDVHFSEFDSVVQARDEAVAILRRIAASPLSDTDQREVLVAVRDADGQRVLTVGLIAVVRYGEVAAAQAAERECGVTG